MSFREFLSRSFATLTFLTLYTLVMSAIYCVAYLVFNGTWPRWS